jgi:hypothetical protein
MRATDRAFRLGWALVAVLWVIAIYNNWGW